MEVRPVLRSPGSHAVAQLCVLHFESRLPWRTTVIRLRETFRRIMKKPSKEFFPGVPKIQYEGLSSTNPLAFKHYNAEELVDGKSMKEHLRFSVTYWHTI